MNRFVLVVVALAGLGGAGGCDKPAEADCRQAIRHMQELIGTASLERTDAELAGEVRRCRGGSTREAVACALKATSKADLERCAFMLPKDK